MMPRPPSLLDFDRTSKRLDEWMPALSSAVTLTAPPAVTRFTCRQSAVA